MKSLLNIRYIYKINSSRLAKAKWNLSLDRTTAIRNNELIGLSSSTATRMIDKINGEENVDEEITRLKKEIKSLNKIKDKSYDQILELRNAIHHMQQKTLIKDIVFVVMDSKKDYDRANKGFILNGIKYVRLVATSGGVKKSTIIYVNQDIHSKLWQWMNNNRDLTKSFVPAKLESYIGLSFSSSLPVSDPKGICVVHDVETTFKDNIILIDGNGRKYPKVENVDNYETTLNACDGMGLMSPALARRWSDELQESFTTSGVCMRNAFLKGMAYTFDFHLFAKEIAKTDQIVDVWGETHNINNIELIINTSMLKLWDSYTSINHYLECCHKNNYEFSLTKLIDEKLDNEQTMNYQFLQSLNLSDEDIYNLCKPTVDEFHDILSGDYRKTLLFLRGINMNKENVLGNMRDFTSGLMVDETLLEDKYVYSKIRHNIKKRIDDAKLGVIKVKGNFSLIAGDPYLFCEAMFGLPVKGLLKSGEVYSKYWMDLNVDEVAMFRAPTTNKESNLVRNIVATEEMLKWYQYMNTITIFNAWDNTASALNGCDFDGDTCMTTNNPYVIKGIAKNQRPIICLQSSSEKVVPTEKDFIKANKSSFGSAIGTITNYATSMYNVIANHTQGSKEWNELSYRLICMQDYQQSEIDKAKGCEARPVPKEWYDYKINKITNDDTEKTRLQKEFNLSVLANKKPYFFIYNYDKLKSEWNKYKVSNDDFCLSKFKCTVKELMEKKNKTDIERAFVESFRTKSPVNLNDCVVNKIAWLFESEFDSGSRHRVSGFDKEKFKSKTPYDQQEFQVIKDLKKQYDKDMEYAVRQKNKFKTYNTVSDSRNNKEVMLDNFKNKIMYTGMPQEKLCDIIVDLCYSNDKSKSFAWEIAGETMIKNLIKNTGNTIKFPALDEDGDLEYCGKRFSVVEVGLSENNL